MKTFKEFLEEASKSYLKRMKEIDDMLDHQERVANLKKKATSREPRTVWDENTRRYKVVHGENEG